MSTPLRSVGPDFRAEEPATPKGAGGGDNGDMEPRVRALEDAVLKINTLLPTLATKEDVAKVEAKIADAKSVIVMWVVGTVLFAQVLPVFLKALGVLP